MVGWCKFQIVQCVFRSIYSHHRLTFGALLSSVIHQHTTHDDDFDKRIEYLITGGKWRFDVFLCALGCRESLEFRKQVFTPSLNVLKTLGFPSSDRDNIMFYLNKYSICHLEGKKIMCHGRAFHFISV